MNIRINDKAYETEAIAYLKVFYPLEVISSNTDEQPTYKITISQSNIEVAYFDGDKMMMGGIWQEKYENLEGKEKAIYGKKQMKSLMYDLCGGYTGIKPPWGILIGIRPTKLASKLFRETGNMDEVYTRLIKDYRVNSRKAKLLVDVLRTQNEVLSNRSNEPSKKNIYIHVPFCPSRCSYCSFTSFSKDKWLKEYETYVDALIKELKSFEGYFENVRSIYIGGGTPTSLTDDDFDKLLCTVHGMLKEPVEEYTVEAGRPDSLSQNKLKSMKHYGVTRISINPQTIHDRTLKKIGRAHNFEDIKRVYHEARLIGFDHINMDMILGLPEESVEDVKASINEVIRLNPESITIHTMALKRGSQLTDEKTQYLNEMSAKIDTMLKVTSKAMEASEYKGYYLYRQKQMVGNFENVGYCKPGKESLYNIHTMEEVESIIAFGAGAISKKVVGKKVKRLDEPKDVRSYLNSLDTIIEKKKAFFENDTL